MKVLCVAAHPDDEILGAGATLAKHVMAGDEVQIVLLGSGATARPDAEASDVIALRQAARAAAGVIGANVIVGNLPDNRFDSVDMLDVVRTIEMNVQEFEPEVVYTHAATDLNIDHRVTHEAVLTACRPLPGSSVRKVLAFEVPSSTGWGFGFQPCVFVDVTREPFARKVKALECYALEMRPYPHPRSVMGVEVIARTRGMQAGVDEAEAFVLVREVA